MAKAKETPTLFVTETRMIRGRVFSGGEKFEGVEASEAELRDWQSKGFLTAVDPNPPGSGETGGTGTAGTGTGAAT